MKSCFFLKIFKEFYLPEMSFGYIYIYSGTPLSRPPTGRNSIGRVCGVAGVVASHLHS